MTEYRSIKAECPLLGDSDGVANPLLRDTDCVAHNYALGSDDMVVAIGRSAGALFQDAQMVLNG